EAFAEIFVGDFDLELARLAGKRGLHIFADSIISFRAKDFRNSFADAVSGVQPEPLSIRAVDEFVTSLGLPGSDEHGPGVWNGFGVRVGVGGGLGGPFGLGGLCRKGHAAADPALVFEPRAHSPFDPVEGPARAREAVFAVFSARPRHAAAVSLSPAFRNVG